MKQVDPLKGNSMRTTSVDVVRIATNGPGDVAGLIDLIKSGKIEPTSILAILGKNRREWGRE
jgi:cyanuric acid amidohydrolase